MTAQENEEAILQELRQIVANILDVDEAAVTDDARFVEDLGVDSLMALEVMVTLEKKYRIKLTEKELAQITCLRSVWGLVTARRAANV